MALTAPTVVLSSRVVNSGRSSSVRRKDVVNSVGHPVVLWQQANFPPLQLIIIIIIIIMKPTRAETPNPHRFLI
jgi:hypothetical protein